jgi:hypothetical protein
MKPNIEKALLEHLSEQFPDQVPDISLSEREVWARVGEQRIVRYLKMIYEEQNENILTREVT